MSFHDVGRGLGQADGDRVSPVKTRRVCWIGGVVDPGVSFADHALEAPRSV